MMWEEINRIRELSLKENLMENLGGQFWTRLEELKEEIEECGYRVLEINDEYVVVENDTDDEEEETVLYLGHANTTIWIERAR